MFLCGGRKGGKLFHEYQNCTPIGYWKKWQDSDYEEMICYGNCHSRSFFAIMNKLSCAVKVSASDFCFPDRGIRSMNKCLFMHGQMKGIMIQ